MRIVRPLVQTAGFVPQAVRDLQRLRQVAQILIRHGFGWLVRGIDLPGMPKVESSDRPTTPERIVQMLKELGPTAVKLGQVLSTRTDLLPEAYTDALQSLQDDVGPLSVDEVHEVLVRELGVGWRERVRSFEETPLATASIAQVHCGVLLGGEEVVFKVQRPGIERIIRADLSILHVLADGLMHEFPEIASVDVDDVLEEFERTILSELDFETEARNQRRVAANFEGVDTVRVPVVYSELSTRKVLCMERLQGVKIRDARATGHDMERVGEHFLQAAYDMLFVHAFFHGDLHPGNVLVLPGEVIGLLDFGMMGRLTQQMKSDVIFIIFALQRGDYRTIARIAYEIGIKSRRVDYRAVERDTVKIMEQYWAGVSIRDMQIGPFVVELSRLSASHGARIPSDYTMFFKALMTTEGLAKALIHEVDPLEAATPYVERLVRERFEFDRLQSDLLYQGMTLHSLLQRLPISFSQLLDDIDMQQLSIGVREIPNPDRERAQEQRVDRMIAGLGACTTLVCGTWMLGQEPLWLWGVPVLTSVLYGLSVVFAGVAIGRRRWGG